MLGFGPISSSAISALPDYLLNAFSVAFTGTVTYEAIATMPYRQLVNANPRVIYTVAISARAVR